VKDNLHPKGLATRREVLGDAYVDKALQNADEFSWPMQALVTEFCWDAVWNRPGLPRKTRSLINIAMLAALNRPHELRVHVIGAVRNGCSREEIREVLLQCAVYCGVPAGVDAFRVAREALAEVDAGAPE
jgi:4-carboxymuconolactone decarboxylase